MNLIILQPYITMKIYVRNIFLSILVYMKTNISNVWYYAMCDMINIIVYIKILKIYLQISFS